MSSARPSRCSGCTTRQKGYDSHEANYARCLSLTAKMGVLTGYYHRARQGKDLPPIRTDLGEAAHFLYLLDGKEPYQGSRRDARSRLRPAR